MAYTHNIQYFNDWVTIISLFKRFVLFESYRYRSKEGETGFPSADLFPKGEPGRIQSQKLIPCLSHGFRSPSTCAICCFPRHVSREMRRKWSSWHCCCKQWLLQLAVLQCRHHLFYREHNRLWSAHTCSCCPCHEEQKQIPWFHDTTFVKSSDFFLLENISTHGDNNVSIYCDKWFASMLENYFFKIWLFFSFSFFLHLCFPAHRRQPVFSTLRLLMYWFHTFLFSLYLHIHK